MNMERNEKVKTYIEIINEKKAEKEEMERQRMRAAKTRLLPFQARVAELVGMVELLRKNGVEIPSRFLPKGVCRFSFKLVCGGQTIDGVQMDAGQECYFAITPSFEYCYSYGGNFSDSAEVFMNGFETFETEVFKWIDELTAGVEKRPTIKTYAIEFKGIAEVKAETPMDAFGVMEKIIGGNVKLTGNFVEVKE